MRKCVDSPSRRGTADLCSNSTSAGYAIPISLNNNLMNLHHSIVKFLPNGSNLFLLSIAKSASVYRTEVMLFAKCCKVFKCLLNGSDAFLQSIA